MADFHIDSDGGETVYYSFAEYPVFVGKGMLSWCPDFKYPAHWHDDLEFSLVLHGTMNFMVNGEEISVPEGSAVFINSRQLHSNFSKDLRDAEYLCTMVHPSILSLTPGFKRAYADPILLRSDLPYVILSPDIFWQRQIIDELKSMNAAMEDGTAAVLRMNASVYRIWSLIFDNLRSGDLIADIPVGLSEIREMVVFIQLNYAENIKLEDIARAGTCGISKCCALFRKYMNMAPGAYVKLYRLNRAREKLLMSEEAVTQIAESCGFSSSSYFGEQFLREYGMTPTEYRKGQKKENLM